MCDWKGIGKCVDPYRPVAGPSSVAVKALVCGRLYCTPDICVDVRVCRRTAVSPLARSMDNPHLPAENEHSTLGDFGKLLFSPGIVQDVVLPTARLVFVGLTCVGSKITVKITDQFSCTCDVETKAQLCNTVTQRIMRHARRAPAPVLNWSLSALENYTPRSVCKSAFVWNYFHMMAHNVVQAIPPAKHLLSWTNFAPSPEVYCTLCFVGVYGCSFSEGGGIVDVCGKSPFLMPRYRCLQHE